MSYVPSRLCPACGERNHHGSCRPDFSWRMLLKVGRWEKQDAGCYRRGRQRIVRHPVRAQWLYYPDVRSDRAWVFRRLATALLNARRP